MSHKIALAGSYSGGSAEELFRGLPHNGLLQFSLVGREVTLQVMSENFEEIKKSLSKMGVNNINILEWKKTGITVANSGKGLDDDESVVISLIPSTLEEGIKSLAVVHNLNLDDATVAGIDKNVRDTLSKAGVTDTLYTIQINKLAALEKYKRAAESATLKALFDSGGVVSIEQ